MSAFTSPMLAGATEPLTEADRRPQGPDELRPWSERGLVRRVRDPAGSRTQQAKASQWLTSTTGFNPNISTEACSGQNSGLLIF